MDDLYRVGEQLAQDNAGFGGDAALADLMAGGGDLEDYLKSYEEMLQQGTAPTQGSMLNKVDAEGGITVQPEPCFVIKTRDTQSGMKIFINVVCNENVEKPHMKSYAELEGEEGCRVPLSVGTPQEDFDKKGEPCVTYDIVCNPDVTAQCKEMPEYRETVVSLCLAAISQKYKINVDQKFKLPKIKYKGTTVQLQRIRKSKDSQIQEVSRGPQANEGPQGHAQERTGPARPDFVVYYARAEAPAVDGFEMDWPAPPETPEQAAAMAYLSGLDLPAYRTVDFQEKIRGTMRNAADRQREEAEAAAAEEAPSAPGEAETKQMLGGRTCVVQVKMTQLDSLVASLRQFSVEVSDECVRILFPPLPRQKLAVHAPLTVWFPRHFCSAQAAASWDPKQDVLTVTLPTSAPKSVEFDQGLLDEVF